jgi:hypothetical protein
MQLELIARWSVHRAGNVQEKWMSYGDGRVLNWNFIYFLLGFIKEHNKIVKLRVSLSLLGKSHDVTLPPHLIIGNKARGNRQWASD